MDPNHSPGIVVDDLVKRYAPDAPPAVDRLSFGGLVGTVRARQAIDLSGSDLDLTSRTSDRRRAAARTA